MKFKYSIQSKICALLLIAILPAITMNISGCPKALSVLQKVEKAIPVAVDILGVAGTLYPGASEYTALLAADLNQVNGILKSFPSTLPADRIQAIDAILAASEKNIQAIANITGLSPQLQKQIATAIQLAQLALDGIASLLPGQTIVQGVATAAVAPHVVARLRDPIKAAQIEAAGATIDAKSMRSTWNKVCPEHKV